MRWTALLAVCLMPLLPVAGGAAPGCDTPAAPTAGWPVASPEREGLDPVLICSIGPRLQQPRDAAADGVVVVRHGTLVYEHYFVDGVAYRPDTVHAMRSITKSVVALLAGIAFDRGWLRHLDGRILPYFPADADLRTPDKNAITLRDLLTMTSGLKWPESAIPYANPSNIERRMNLASDPYRFVLAQPMAALPGAVWNYNSGGVELLGRILAEVAHQPLDRFARQALFEPLGIAHWAWLRAPNGTPGASWGLWLRPRDLAKLGQLVLNHGVWSGQQIVSTQWIDAMTAPQVPRPSSWPRGPYAAYSYGYLWWLGHLATHGRSAGFIAGIGWGGQRLYVVPSLDLVVAVTASDNQSGAAQHLAGSTALAIALRAADPPAPAGPASAARSPAR